MQLPVIYYFLAISLSLSHGYYLKSSQQQLMQKQFVCAEGQENGADNGNRANGNENVDAGQQGNLWWGIVKEIQMIVFGFITSLLPGFHNIDQNLSLFFSFCILLQQKQLRKIFNLQSQIFNNLILYLFCALGINTLQYKNRILIYNENVSESILECVQAWTYQGSLEYSSHFGLTLLSCSKMKHVVWRRMCLRRANQNVLTNSNTIGSCLLASGIASKLPKPLELSWYNLSTLLTYNHSSIFLVRFINRLSYWKLNAWLRRNGKRRIYFTCFLI